MFKEIFLYIIGILIVAGCSSPMEKSVMEHLTSNELDKVAGKDNSFLATYSIVEGKWNNISTPEDSARWKNLTYGRLHSFINIIKDAELNSPVIANLGNEWENEYSRNLAQADSIASFWNEYLASNSPDSLVSCRYLGTESEMIRNINKEIDTLVKSKIQIKTLKFPIDSVSLVYIISTPDSANVGLELLTSGLNFINHNKKIYDSVTVKVYPNLVPHGKLSLLKNDSSLTFEYVLNSVYSNGICHNTDSLRNNVPASVMKMLENNNVYNREQVIKEYINPELISKSAYLKLNAEEYYCNIDSLAFRFLEL